MIHKSEEFEGFQTYLPQIPTVTAAWGSTYEEAVANSIDIAEDVLQIWYQEDGAFPVWRHLSEYQEGIEEVQGEGPAWDQFNIEVDLDKLVARVEDHAATTIQGFFLWCKFHDFVPARDRQRQSSREKKN